MKWDDERLMGFYHNNKNVKDYIDMAEGYDGTFLIEILKKHVSPGSTVLELGMGPGKDLDILRKTFHVTGSDISQIFLDLYQERTGFVDLIVLDACTLEIGRTFDCIYSNKVLIHLTKAELRKSFQRQRAVLNDNGILFHSFWKGTKEEEHHGLRFIYYTKEELRKMIGDGFEIIEIAAYKEIEANDSLYIILKKK